ncbi:MAG TPA: Rv3235 family protein [Acidimicrobiales bacterium]|nr:Rv3235 family protein [Acidimicrobiales bacterium]
MADRQGGGEGVHAWAARFAQAVVEVLGGDRPLTQLVRWTSGRVYADLGRRVTVLGRTAPAGQRRRTIRPQVRTIRVFQPTDDAAEVSVHVRYGERSRAIAARLERGRGRWQCTDLRLG